MVFWFVTNLSEAVIVIILLFVPLENSLLVFLSDIFAKYALRESGITRNVLVDKEGRIVKLTRLYNEEEFASLVQKINEMLK